MRALLLTDQLTYSSDYTAPAPVPGEAIIRVTHAGICNTDLELLKGYMGFHGILGHEFVGVSWNRRTMWQVNCMASNPVSESWRRSTVSLPTLPRVIILRVHRTQHAPR